MAVEDLDDVGKWGQGFTAVDEIEEVDIGDWSSKQPTYVSAKLHRGGGGWSKGKCAVC
jgi:hypothetical protein